MGEGPTEGASRDLDSTLTVPAPRRAGAGLPGRLGSYRILRLIGEGGMGSVYEAEQEKPRRTVALKVIKPGVVSSQALRRFELESQVLGMLQHPGIARIYEAGTADSGQGLQPFFAMELVRGRNLLEHAAARGLGMRDRLELVARVCDAVQHAHQKGVIHRDLKPINILVDESGEPKVLDFGVARATDAELQTTVQTQTGVIVGTIPYMSPEQVAADPAGIDTRSDVYALGVVLYELLSGRLPYDLRGKPIPEAARVIGEEEPARLSSVDRSCRGDVETIVAKALEKDRSRRYGSAAELGADIRRFLSDQPIVARPPSAGYQIRKFAKRNKVLVAGFAVAFVALAAGAAISTWQAVRATRAEQLASARLVQAEQQAARAGAINGFLLEMLGSANPEALRRTDQAKGREVTVLQVLAEAVRRLDAGSLKDQPLVEAAARQVIGDTYKTLGRLDDADPNLRRSLELYEKDLGRDSVEIADAMSSLAWLRWAQGKQDEAEPLLHEAYGIKRRLLKEDDPALAKSLRNLAVLHAEMGKNAEAEPMYRQALAVFRHSPGPEDLEAATTLKELGMLLQEEGRLDESEPLLREALEIRRRVLGDVHPDVARALHDLAFLLKAQGKLPEAEQSLREAIRQWRAIYGNEHTDLAASLVNLGVVLRDEGRLDDAEQEFRQGLAIQRRVLAPDHPDIGSTLYNIARLLSSKGMAAQAEPLYGEAVSIGRKTYDQASPTLAGLLAGAAANLTALGNARRAEPLLREALAIYEKTYPAGDWHRCQVMSLLGEALTKQGRYTEAEPLLLDGYAGLKDNPAVSADRRRNTLERIVQLYEGWAAASPGAVAPGKVTEWKKKRDLELMTPAQQQ
jgi:tetratricopeptide (TPR) repeat protein